MQDHIGYDAIIESAMRDVVFKVLKKAENGLTGGHHFVVTYSTKYFGVVMSEYLKQKFPSEITIVIQHQYQSLMALENCFKIRLSFSGVMESLTIPYKSIISFSDPSVNFGLKFNVDDSDEGIIEEQNQEQLIGRFQKKS